MTSSKLLNLPTELLLHIIQELATLTDVLAAAASCKELRKLISSATGSAVTRAVGLRSFFAFDDALRAIRSMALPAERLARLMHYDLARGEYTEPPTVDFFLRLADGGPTLAEVPRLLKLRDAVGAAWLPETFTSDPRVNYHEFLEWWSDVASERFYRGAYRYLVYGAVFREAYYGPIRASRAATSTPADGLTDHGDGGTEMYRALGQYPIYTMDMVEHQRDSHLKKLFGGFIDWLLVDGNKRQYEKWGYPADGYRPSIGKITPTPGEYNGIREILLLLSVWTWKSEIKSSRSDGTPVPNFIDKDDSQTCVVTFFDQAASKSALCKDLDTGDIIECNRNTTWAPVHYLTRMFPNTFLTHEDKEEGFVMLDFFRISLKEHFGLRLRRLRLVAHEVVSFWRMVGMAFIGAEIGEEDPYTPSDILEECD